MEISVRTKRWISLLLAVVTLLSLLPLSAVKSYAAPTTQYKVEIVSFARGAQADLRSSELLEARIYQSTDGGSTWTATDNWNGTPISKLSYKWENGLNTYLYLYNSHNMYNINNTNGEISVSSGANSTKTGFAWASVYGAGINNNNLVGTVTVTVSDRAGNKLTDSHTGIKTNVSSTDKKPTYSYSGFLMPNLKSDINAIAFGIFENEQKTVLDMLGEAGIVHITCTASKVSSAKVKGAGGDLISVSERNPYTVSAKKAGSAVTGGDAVLTITVKKDNCKFHQYSGECAGDVKVYVYKKPIPTATATTITLTPESVDDRCTYYINNVQGVEQQDGSVLFTGLTPNTTYEIKAKGQTSDTEPVYAYVNSTTLPLHNANINIYLSQASKNAGVATLTDITDIFGSDAKVALKAANGTDMELTKMSTGVYASKTVSTGTYGIFYFKDNESGWIDTKQQITITDSSRSSDLHFYGVEYDAAGGAPTPATQYYYYGQAVSAEAAPTRDGYAFLGWNDGTATYAPGATVTSSIRKAYKVTALWEEDARVNVKVNISLDHTYIDDEGNLACNNDDAKNNVAFQLVSRLSGTGDPYLETGNSASLTPAICPGFNFVGDEEGTSAYTATVDTFTDLSAKYDYTLALSKTNYNVTSISATQDKDGNWTIDVDMKFDPKSHDLVFSVDMAEETPKELYPDAVIAKVAFWNTDTDQWSIISQHENTDETVVPGVRVDIDPETGCGTGRYPVWATDTNDTPYVYRMVITSFVYPDGTVIAANEHGKNGAQIIITDPYTTAVYTAELQDADYRNYSEVSGSFFVQGIQEGELNAVIAVNMFDVTMDPNGGLLGGSNEVTTLADLYRMPDISTHIPTRTGGYLFDGWELVSGTPADEGALLTGDLSYRAKWIDPLTVEGTVAVAGTYELNGQNHTIKDADRATSVTVALEKNIGGSFVEQKVATVQLVYSGDLGTGTYRFEELPNDASEYRIEILAVNYNTTYHNENSSGDQYSDYSLDSYIAVDKDLNNIAQVNAYLVFNPTSFNLQYAINSDAIGAYYRPRGAEMLVLYDDGAGFSNPQMWPVISQMVFDEQNIGQNTALTAGHGSNTYAVWNTDYNGAYYDYAIRLNGYTNYAGIETAFDAQNAPFTVSYNGAARFDEQNGQTKVLTATLTPKMYDVNFLLGFVQTEKDFVTGMDSYEVGESYRTSHTWSFDTPITAAPAREGYQFLGWYDTNDAKVTSIPASVADDVTLTAKWQQMQDVVNVTVNIDHTYQQGEETGVAGNYDKELIVQLTHMLRGSDTSVDVADHIQRVSNWHTDNGSTNTDTYKFEPFYENLSSAYDYSANVTLDGYYVVSKTVNKTINPDGSTTHNVVIDMKYNPDMLNFQFRVELADMAESLRPESAEVKVTCWYDPPVNGSENLPLAWNTITQHWNTTVTVELEDTQDGIIYGIGDYPVWQWLNKKESVPYYYRIEIVALTLQDGTVVAMAEQSDDTTYAGNNYTAIVHTDEDCAWAQIDGTTETTELDGAYGEQGNTGYVQKGNVKAVIDVTAYTVTLDADGGSFESGDGSVVFNDQIRMPDISSYIPSRVGYTFTGWDATVQKGSWLTKDVVLTAQWEPNVYNITYFPNGGTIQGTYKSTYTVEDSFSHPDATLTGHEFAGWYTASDFTGYSAGVEAGTTGHLTFYAKWTKNGYDYTVQYYYDGIEDETLRNHGTAEFGSFVDAFQNKLKDGYRFDSVVGTTITTDVAANIVKVYYEKDDFGYCVEYYYDGILDDAATVTDNETFGERIPHSEKAKDGFMLVAVEGGDKTVSSDASSNVVRYYYETDLVGNDGPDEIPDKYQKKVTFKVVNGTWSNTTSADIVTYVTLLKDGKWDAAGTASLSAPTGMLPLDGFQDGAWDVIPPATVSGTEDATYTFSFTKIPAAVPETGDSSNLHLWIVLMTFSLTGLVATALSGKKRKTAA